MFVELPSKNFAFLYLESRCSLIDWCEYQISWDVTHENWIESTCSTSYTSYHQHLPSNQRVTLHRLSLVTHWQCDKDQDHIVCISCLVLLVSGGVGSVSLSTVQCQLINVWRQWCWSAGVTRSSGGWDWGQWRLVTCGYHHSTTASHTSTSTIIL